MSTLANSSWKPQLALTLGDCAGIGPELALRMLADPDVNEICRLIVYGNIDIMKRVSAASGIPFPDDATVIDHSPVPDSGHFGLPERGHVIYNFPFSAAEQIRPGLIQAACGRLAHDWICAAVKDSQEGYVDGLITAPINKEALNAAGIPFRGHTELLAHLTGGTIPCMAFHSERLLISLATIHKAIYDVPRLLTTSSLLHTIRLTATACENFNDRPKPHIAVLALNPHAGENGLFGQEERDIIKPAIEAARAEGFNVSGPLVPDTAFTWLLANKPSPYDGYVAIYHDQGLIPFKMVAFDTGVNVTLGLPIIRTSPDHGTAFDIAWKGQASPKSMIAAIRFAARLAENSGQ